MGRDPEQWLAALQDHKRRKSWKYRDLKRALESVGTSLVSQKGSHRTFKHGDYPNLVTLVDTRNATLPYGHVADVLRLMESILEKG